MIRMSGQLTLHLIHKSFDDDIHIRVEEGKHTYRDILRAAQSYWGIESQDYLLMGEDGKVREELDEPLTKEETLYLVKRGEAVPEVAPSREHETEGNTKESLKTSETYVGELHDFSIPLSRLELPDGTEFERGELHHESGKLLIHSDDFGIASPANKIRVELKKGEVILDISGIFLRISLSDFPPRLLSEMQRVGLLTSVDIDKSKDPNFLLYLLVKGLGEGEWR